MQVNFDELVGEKAYSIEHDKMPYLHLKMYSKLKTDLNCNTTEFLWVPLYIYS